jgi:glutamate-1-semialdehyde 2,1-aminomutase
MNRACSDALFTRASEVIPGAVNSPVRAFKAVGGKPLFIRNGKGSRVTDCDGNEYVDYVGSWGPLLFGHAPQFVTEAVISAVERGSSFGAPTEAEVEMAELVRELVPSIEKIRFVSSGSEATSSAVRLARGFTGRTKIVKCAGCYHGSVDALLVTAGSGVATLGIPETAGVPASVAAETIVIEYNSFEQLKSAFERFGQQIACFILEPVAGNMGLVPPADGYLALARELTQKHGALLIFDEVISGFRIAAGGAQEVYGVLPDLTCLGKIIGGGFPVGAYGGKQDIMDKLAPVGPVYQAGTLSGNPVAMAAGLAMLNEIKRRGNALYQQLQENTCRLAESLAAIFKSRGKSVSLNQAGSLFTLFFTDKDVQNYSDAKSSDAGTFGRYFNAMLERGIYLPPSQYECCFVSAGHSGDDFAATLESAEKAAADLSE